MNKTKRLTIIGIAVAAVALALAQFVGGLVTADRGELRPFTSEVGRFTMMVPSAVRKEHESIDTKLGMLESMQFSSRSKFVQFLVTYYDYPAEYMESSDAATILKSAADGMAANVSGKVKKQDAFIYEGNAMRTVTVKAPKDLWLRSRVMLVGSRLYQVMALSNGRHINDKKVDEVFKSFHLLELSEPENTSSPDSSGAQPDADA